MTRDADWSPAEQPPTLESGALHVWQIALQQPASTMERLADSLDAAERARAARFAFVRDRERFLVAHGALREIVGRYLACAPSAVAFHHSAQGKPEIVEPGNPATGALRFSLAHSGEIALISVTSIGATGVDVEQTRSDVEALAIAERFFATEEQDALRAQPEDRRAAYFYRLWTCKEAYLKAVGVGLTAPLQEIIVRFGAPAGVSIALMGASAASVGRWSLAELAPGAGYAGAVAVDGRIESVAVWQWESWQR